MSLSIGFEVEVETRVSRDNIIKIVTGKGRIFYLDCATGNVMYSTYDLEAVHYTIDHSEPSARRLLIGKEFKDWVDYFNLANLLEKLSIPCPYRGLN